MIFEVVDGVTLRSMCCEDLPALQKLSPPEVKPLVQFFVYSTIVATIDDEVVGYTQFCLTPDGILHSYAIRVAADHKGRGIGTKLIACKERLAQEAGAKFHFYAVAQNGEEALKKLLLKAGHHLCQDHDGIQVYAKGFISV